MSRFALARKQLVQEAKLKNSNLIIFTLKSKCGSVYKLIEDDNIRRKFDIKDSLVTENEQYKILTIAVIDEDPKAGKNIEEEINNTISLQKEKYQNCDIIYSYEVEEVSDEKSSYC